MAVAAVELVRPTPDWEAALAAALTRPAGVPERRSRPSRGVAAGRRAAPPRRRRARVAAGGHRRPGQP